MIAGHFGLAAIVKSRERQVPLWALMLATAWLDVVFIPLFLTGIERIDPAPGATGSYGGGIIHADYTHSLVGALVLAGLFGLVAAVPWGKRAGAVLAGVVFSHWLLDLIVHRADMPVLPADIGNLPRLGFGLWRAPAAAAAVELALVVIGAFFYTRAAMRTPNKRGGRTGGLGVAAGLLVLAGGLATLAADVLGF